MSNTTLQIKRSATTAIPVSLSNGELAYSGNSTSNSLFIGHPDGSTGVIRIAGGKYPYLHQAAAGTLTANAVVITDSNAFVSNVFTSGLFVATSVASPAANATAALITSITPQANTTQLGAAAGGSNTELVTSYAIKTYVDGKVASASLNTAVAYTFTNVITHNANLAIVGNTTGVLLIGTTAANIVANATVITVSGNATVYSTINSTAFSGSANDSSYLGGTSLSTLQGQITGNAATAYANATSYADSKAATAYSNAVANAAALYQTTAGLSANVATLTANAATYLGNSSGTVANIASWITGNSATAYSNATAYADTKAATAYSNAVANAAALYQTTAGLSANVATLTANAATYLGNSSGTVANIASWITGNSATAYTNATSYADTKAATAYSNATTFASNASNISSGTLAAARLPANVVFWSNTNTFTATQTFADVTINGNTALGDSSADVISINGVVNTNIMPSANVTYNVGNNTVRWNEVHASNVHSTYGYFDSDVQIGGNLYISGNSVSINVQNLSVTDSLIQLASNNNSTDLLDIGFFGNYQSGADPHEHTGFYRDHVDGVYKLFDGLQDAPTNTTINSAGVGFRSATLQSYLNSSGLTTNSTVVNITANSTVSVSLVANTLSLSTALPATSGGTGWGSFTAGDILYASNTTYLSKLSVGTDGQILQMQGSSIAWASIDGGTF